MKQTLVIGSTVVDVVITLDRLPATREDVHVIKQTMSLGGCAYNASDILRHFKVPYTLFSPIGTGTYGSFVREKLAEKGIKSPIPTPDKENGCCYCFVEASGERTFISYHGAEYLFEKEWFELLDADGIDSVYICGLEIEETTGTHIIEYLEAHPEYTIYFAPGPRINVIPEENLDRIFELSPVLHLNDDEALSYTKKASVEEAAKTLYERIHQVVIVTMGKDGACLYDENGYQVIPGFKAEQIDTIGAGDSHIGAVMAGKRLGMSWPEAVSAANKVAAAVVGVQGALLPDEIFSNLM